MTELRFTVDSDLEGNRFVASLEGEGELKPGYLPPPGDYVSYSVGRSSKRTMSEASLATKWGVPMSVQTEGRSTRRTTAARAKASVSMLPPSLELPRVDSEKAA